MKPVLKKGMTVTFAGWAVDVPKLYQFLRRAFGPGFMGKEYKVVEVSGCATYPDCAGAKGSHLGCKGKVALWAVKSTNPAYMARCYSFCHPKTGKYELALRDAEDLDLDGILGL